MKVSNKNLKAYEKGKEDRINGVLFVDNHYLYLRSIINSSWWDKGWKEQDKIMSEKRRP